jgi:hypothetical protein
LHVPRVPLRRAKSSRVTVRSKVAWEVLSLCILLRRLCGRNPRVLEPARNLSNERFVAGSLEGGQSFVRAAPIRMRAAVQLEEQSSPATEPCPAVTKFVLFNKAQRSFGHPALPPWTSGSPFHSQSLTEVLSEQPGKNFGAGRRVFKLPDITTCKLCLDFVTTPPTHSAPHIENLPNMSVVGKPSHPVTHHLDAPGWTS